MLDGRLHVVRSNPAARQLCALWSRAEKPNRRTTPTNQVRVPTAIADACRHLRHEWELALHVTPDARIVRRRRLTHAVVPTLSASITMVGEGGCLPS